MPQARRSERQHFKTFGVRSYHDRFISVVEDQHLLPESAPTPHVKRRNANARGTLADPCPLGPIASSEPVQSAGAELNRCLMGPRTLASMCPLLWWKQNTGTFPRVFLAIPGRAFFQCLLQTLTLSVIGSSASY